MTNLKYLHLAQHLFLMLDFWTFDLNLRKTPIRVQELLLSLSGDVSSDEERQKSSSSSSSTKILGGKRRTLFEEVDVWHRRSPPSEGLDLPLGPPPSHLLRGSRVLWPPGAHLQADPGPSAPESRAWVPGSGAARESFWISLCCVPDVLVPKQNRRRIFGPVGRRRGGGGDLWAHEARGPRTERQRSARGRARVLRAPGQRYANVLCRSLSHARTCTPATRARARIWSPVSLE